MAVLHILKGLNQGQQVLLDQNASAGGVSD
jgi:hypothetical protein